MDLSTAFVHGGLRVSLSFASLDPIEVPDREEKFLRLLTHQVVEIENASDERVVERLAAPENREELARTLVQITSRINLALRNIGIVTAVNEISFDATRIDSLLREWQTSIADGGEYALMFEPNALLEALLRRAPHETRDLFSVRDWEEIEEAIEENLEPKPEQEFLANAVEYLRLQNRRAALLESVVCLEIVLTQYLKAYLGLKKGFSSKRIDNLLSSNLHLSARVGLILELVLTPDEIKKLELDRVLKAISWRNEIVHKTGHLPKNLPDRDCDAAIYRVLELARFLARQRDVIRSGPELERLADAIADEMKVPPPLIQIGRGRRLVIRFDLSPESARPTKDELLKLTEFVSAKCKEYQDRIDPEKHLFLSFFQRNEVVAFVVEGQVVYTDEIVKLVVNKRENMQGQDRADPNIE
ncbi:MAG: hypothetical protein LAN37_01640 [Acidobacteriia bacterium]|nr:hypothetical protein [Terriglobia bacterium]